MKKSEAKQQNIQPDDTSSIAKNTNKPAQQAEERRRDELKPSGVGGNQFLRDHTAIFEDMQARLQEIVDKIRLQNNLKDKSANAPEKQDNKDSNDLRPPAPAGTTPALNSAPKNNDNIATVSTNEDTTNTPTPGGNTP